MNTPINILQHKSAKQAAKEALDQVNEERKGEQLGLYTRFNSLNISAGKYFRFANVFLLAGLSGHGKSAFLTMLLDDFINKEINKPKFKVLELHFCYEMSASNEMLRQVSNKFGKSYGYLLSSEYDKTTKKYNTVSDDEVKQYAEYLEKLGKRPIVYFETAGNLVQLENTIYYFSQKYPEYELIISIDHTLLSEKLDEDSDIQLMANTAKVAIRLRKRGYMVILLGQLNNLIEDFKRIKDASLHYPMKSDIYAQGQLFNAVDHAYVIHRPELLKIMEYGRAKRPSKGLIHVLKLKARHGKVGSIWFKEDFMNGRIIELSDNNDEDKNINLIANS